MNIISYADKNEMMFKEAKQLESQAERKEILLKHQASKGDLSLENIEISNLYLSAIRSKMALLNKLT